MNMHQEMLLAIARDCDAHGELLYGKPLVDAANAIGGLELQVTQKDCEIAHLIQQLAEDKLLLRECLKALDLEAESAAGYYPQKNPVRSAWYTIRAKLREYFGQPEPTPETAPKP